MYKLVEGHYNESTDFIEKLLDVEREEEVSDSVITDKTPIRKKKRESIQEIKKQVD